MVTTGFSKPYVATYSASGTTVTYSGLTSLGRGVSNEMSINTASSNDFYADNVLAETVQGQFAGGTATVTVDGLADAAATLILGLPATTNITVGSATVAVQGYGSAMNPGYVGYGFVKRTMLNGTAKYRAVVFPKVMFAVPGENATTAGEDIDWQTQELEATILRDDTTAQNWKRVSAELSTETEAENAVKVMLGGTV